jgi:putative transposase
MRRMNEMSYFIGVKVRIYPSNEQKRMIAKNDSAARFIYNRLVSRSKELYQLSKVNLYCRPVADRIDYLNSLGSNLTDFKALYPFLEDKDIDSLAIMNAKQNYLTAWNNFKKNKNSGVPVFHKKGYSKSYQTNAQYNKAAKCISDGNVHLLDKEHIKLPKLGSVKFKGSDVFVRLFNRKCETRIGTITVSMDNCGDYFVSFQVASVSPFHKTLPVVGKGAGIDVNVKNLYTDSDGNEIQNQKYYSREQKKLAKMQRKLARRKERARKIEKPLRDAKNYQKQRVKVAALLRKISKRRNNYLNVVSKRLVESQDYIFAENIKSGNLMKNHKLARLIADVSWNKLLNMLEYKSEFYGRLFKKVPTKNTTQMCHICGYINTGKSKLTLDVRSWICPNCGTFHNRDNNSAINIKNLGIQMYLQV